MAKQLNFDLAEKSEGPCCCGPVTSETRKYYPSFHHSGEKKLDIPDEGVMTIRYKKVSSSMSESERDGKRYSCCIEAHEIVSVDGEEVEAPSKRSRDAEDALDKLMDEKKKESY